MLKRVLVLSLPGMMCWSLLAAPALAQDTPGEGQDPAAAMMEAYKKAAEPGAHHKHLNYFVGKWKLTVKSFMGGPEPTVETASASYKWILGNRFLVADVEGTMMGSPFMGHAMTGYDNARKQYTDIWCDSMGTGFMISYGTCDPSGKNWTYEGEYMDPVTGQKTTTKQEVKIVDDKSFVFSMFGPGPDGNEMKMMEITYERS